MKHDIFQSYIHTSCEINLIGKWPNLDRNLCSQRAGRWHKVHCSFILLLEFCAKDVPKKTII